jgi:hypothetical protein
MALEMHSDAAEVLMIGTALAESDLRYIKQVGGGPALGVFQVELATALDVRRYLARKDSLAGKLRTHVLYDIHSLTELQFGRKMMVDLDLGCAIARIKYWMDPNPLPAATDLEGLARCHKRIYNGPGKATPEKFVSAYMRAHASVTTMQVKGA